MPYEIEQDGDSWNVVNSDSHEVKARHAPPDAKAKAERQAALLRHVEADKSWDGESGE